MPKNIHEITVFVSSPQDVVEERENLEEIINEINVIWAKQEIGMRLNLVRWETHVYPDMGIDGQDVINKQINDYDIFIGIMWKRFGTQTERAGSGTVEEFEDAYKKYQENPSLIKLMFYFNNAPINPSEIDPQQLILVNEFREKLEGKGLYWIYNGPDDFSRQVRTHLNLQMPYWQKIIRGENQETCATIITDENVTVKVEEDDEGFFELMEIGDKNAAELEIINKTIEEISKTFGEEMEDITSNNPPNTLTPPEIRQASNQMASIMDKFASDFEDILPEFSKIINKTIDAYSRATLISTDFYKDREELTKILISVQGAKNEFIASIEPIETFKRQLSMFPRITKPFNKSKKHTLNVLNSFSSEMSNAINMMTDVENSIQEILSDLNDANE
ncbi:hypothetical protein DSECCO2_481960 [anaerobic digester metagenome]